MIEKPSFRNLNSGQISKGGAAVQKGRGEKAKEDLHKSAKTGISCSFSKNRMLFLRNPYHPPPNPPKQK